MARQLLVATLLQLQLVRFTIRYFFCGDITRWRNAEKICFFPFGNIIFRVWKFNRSKIYHRRLGLAGKVLGLLRLNALHFVGSESVFFLNWKTAKNPYTWVKHFKC